MSEEIIIAIISSGALSTLLTFLINKLQKKDNLENAVMQLLGMTIRQRCEAAIEKERISSEELAQLQSMNTLYKSMGGNGYIRVLMSKIELLSVFVED